MNVARIVEVRNAHTVLVGKHKCKRSCWGFRLGGRVLKCGLVKLRIRVRLDLSGSGQGPVNSYC